MNAGKPPCQEAVLHRECALAVFQTVSSFVVLHLAETVLPCRRLSLAVPATTVGLLSAAITLVVCVKENWKVRCALSGGFSFTVAILV